MFRTREAMIVSNRVWQNADAICRMISESFSRAMRYNAREVTFFRELLGQIQARFNTALPGLRLTCRVHEIHQKPRVRVGPTSDRTYFQCELADLLVIVKYRLPTGDIERKAMLFQVKLSNKGSETCDIDLNQLTLLLEWPSFEFGKQVNGRARLFTVENRSGEFGSYLLAPRQGTKVDRHCGPYFCSVAEWTAAPPAIAISQLSRTAIGLSEFQLFRGGGHCLFSQLAFVAGEHLDYSVQTNRLVAALYRYIGWDPDPPSEFDGYSKTLESEDEPGFAVIEFVVESEEGDKGRFEKAISAKK